jgi:hypothetical protein
MQRKYGVDKPHIFWSKYWAAYECKLGKLSRIGPTMVAAMNNFQAAKSRGKTR